jgi:genome maintenance protein MGM101
MKKQKPMRTRRAGRDTKGRPLPTRAIARREATHALRHVDDAELARVMPFATGLATSPFSDVQQQAMASTATDEELDVRPENGAVYMPHVHIRRRLSRAFGTGGWRLMPSPGAAGVMQKQVQGKKADNIFQSFQLWVGSYAQPVAEAFGFARYYSNNPAMDYGDAIEAMKSNALLRCAKALDIGGLVEWDKRAAQAFRDRCCVAVMCDTSRGQRLQWRRRDSDPLPGERRPAKPDEIAQRTGRPADDHEAFVGASRKSEARDAEIVESDPATNTDPKVKLVPAPAKAEDTPYVFVNITDTGKTGQTKRGATWHLWDVFALHSAGVTRYALFEPDLKPDYVRRLIASKASVLLELAPGKVAGEYRITAIHVQ